MRKLIKVIALSVAAMSFTVAASAGDQDKVKSVKKEMHKKADKAEMKAHKVEMKAHKAEMKTDKKALKAKMEAHKAEMKAKMKAKAKSKIEKN